MDYKVLRTVLGRVSARISLKTGQENTKKCSDFCIFLSGNHSSRNAILLYTQVFYFGRFFLMANFTR